MNVILYQFPDQLFYTVYTKKILENYVNISGCLMLTLCFISSFTFRPGASGGQQGDKVQRALEIKLKAVWVTDRPEARSGNKGECA